MPHWLPYLGLAILPLLVVLPFNVTAFSWGFQHGNEPMPHDLALRSKKLDNFYGSWLRDALLLLTVLSLTIHYGVPFSRIGLRLDDWRRNFFVGIGVSLLQVSLQVLVWKLTPPVKGSLGEARLLEGSGTEWIISNIHSVLAQEIWIAFCLSTLMQTGRSTVMSLVLIGMVFGAAHYQYKLGALATALYGVVFASLFLWRGSLLPSFVVHYVGNVSSFYLVRRNDRLLRGIE
jgi:membrane protease YdiL (CAAX protease family)